MKSTSQTFIYYFLILIFLFHGISAFANTNSLFLTKKPKKNYASKKKIPLYEIRVQPFLFESARIQNYRHRLNSQLGMGLDKFIPKNVIKDSIEQSYAKLLLDVDYRFSPTQELEFSIKFPYVIQSIDFDGSGGEQTESVSSHGLGQITTGIKIPLSSYLSVKLFTELPTADTNAYPAEGEGTNFGFSFLSRLGRWHLRVGKLIKTQYERHFPTATFLRDPGDVTMVSMALTAKDTTTFKEKVYVGGILETNGYFISRDKENGVLRKDTNGVSTNILLGFVLGNIKADSVSLTKMAAVFSAGEESHQSFDIPRGIGDLHLILNYELRWGKTKK